jgi:cyclic lactone autoinducer peptide
MKRKGEKKNIGVKVIKKMVSNSLILDTYNTTCISIYQPKAPEALKKFSKINTK